MILEIVSCCRSRYIAALGSARHTALLAQVSTPTELFDSCEELVYSALIGVRLGRCFVRFLRV
jgi:hypothetical protein